MPLRKPQPSPHAPPLVRVMRCSLRPVETHRVLLLARRDALACWCACRSRRIRQRVRAHTDIQVRQLHAAIATGVVAAVVVVVSSLPCLCRYSRQTYEPVAMNADGTPRTPFQLGSVTVRWRVQHIASHRIATSHRIASLTGGVAGARTGPHRSAPRLSQQTLRVARWLSQHARLPEPA